MRHVAWVALCALAGAAACGGAGAEPDDTQSSDQQPISDTIGVVEVPEARRLPDFGEVGSVCSLPSQCDTGMCLGAGFHPDFDGGYCTRFCNPVRPSQCGLGASCVDAGVHICVRKCVDSADCYGGQKCIGKMCVPQSVVANVPKSTLLPDGDQTLETIAESVQLVRLNGHVRTLTGMPRLLASVGPNGPTAEPQWPITPFEKKPGKVDWPDFSATRVIHSRAVGHPGHALAILYLTRQLEALGLRVEAQEFRRMPATGGETGTVLLPQKIVNLRAILPGTMPLLPRVIVMAHYDSRAGKTAHYNAAADPAPGAGDNATGVGAVVEIARILSKDVGQLRRSVEFLLVDAAQEGWSGQRFDGQAGSRAYVGSLDLGMQPFCALNLDSIAWNSGADQNDVWIGVSDRFTFASQIGIEAIRDHLRDFPMITTRSDAFFAQSDHLSFAKQGLCEAYVYSWPPNPNEDSAYDTLATIDWDKYVGAVKASALIVGAWANYRMPPILKPGE